MNTVEASDIPGYGGIFHISNTQSIYVHQNKSYTEHHKKIGLPRARNVQ